VFSDGAGGVERIRMDLSALPEVLEALDTTADPTKTRSCGVGPSSAPAVEGAFDAAVRRSA